MDNGALNLNPSDEAKLAESAAAALGGGAAKLQGTAPGGALKLSHTGRNLEFELNKNFKVKTPGTAPLDLSSVAPILQQQSGRDLKKIDPRKFTNLDEEAKQYLDEEEQRLEEEQAQKAEKGYRELARQAIKSKNPNAIKNLPPEAQEYLDDEQQKFQDEGEQKKEDAARGRARSALQGKDAGGREARQNQDPTKDLDPEAQQYLDDERQRMGDEIRRAVEDKHRAMARQALKSGKQEDVDSLHPDAKQHVDDEQQKMLDERKQAVENRNRAQARQALKSGKQSDLDKLHPDARQHVDEEKQKLADEQAQKQAAASRARARQALLNQKNNRQPPQAGPNAQNVNRDRAQARRGGGGAPVPTPPSQAAPTGGTKTPPQLSRKQRVLRKAASALRSQRSKMKKERDEAQAELNKLEQSAINIRKSKSFRLLKIFLPGVCSRITDTLNSFKNKVGTAKIVALKAQIILLEVTKKILQTAEVAGAGADAGRLTLRIIMAGFSCYIIPGIIAIILSPVILMGLMMVFLFVGGSQIVKAIQDVIKQVDELLKKLKEELKKEEGKVKLRKKIKNLNDALYRGGAAPTPESAGGEAQQAAGNAPENSPTGTKPSTEPPKAAAPTGGAPAPARA